MEIEVNMKGLPNRDTSLSVLAADGAGDNVPVSAFPNGDNVRNHCPTLTQHHRNPCDMKNDLAGP